MPLIVAAAIVLPAIALLAALLVALRSIHRIGPTQVGLVTKRFGVRKLSEDNPIAFRGEAGYQANLLMPGARFKLWPIYTVTKFPWVQVPAGVRQLHRPADISHQRWREGRAAAGADTGLAGADPPGGVPGHHLARGLRAPGGTGAGGGKPPRQADTGVVRPVREPAQGARHRAAGRPGRRRPHHRARR